MPEGGGGEPLAPPSPLWEALRQVLDEQWAQRPETVVGVDDIRKEDTLKRVQSMDPESRAALFDGSFFLIGDAHSDVSGLSDGYHQVASHEIVIDDRRRASSDGYGWKVGSFDDHGGQYADGQAGYGYAPERRY